MNDTEKVASLLEVILHEVYGIANDQPRFHSELRTLQAKVVRLEAAVMGLTNVIGLTKELLQKGNKR